MGIDSAIGVGWDLIGEFLDRSGDVDSSGARRHVMQLLKVGDLDGLAKHYPKSSAADRDRLIAGMPFPKALPKTAQEAAKMQQDLETCGCGRPARYIIGKGDRTSCNKYARCPTYEQLKKSFEDLTALFQKVRPLFDTIGNGRCSLCGSVRTYNFQRAKPEVGPCENDNCISHEISKALGDSIKAE